MSPRVSPARPKSSRSRRQRLAAGAVLASTTLLGTYLAAVRPQPTYASPNRSDASQQPDGRGLLRPAISAPSISTCADAAPQDVVSDDTQLRAAILRSDDDSVICIDGTIGLFADLPPLDDTTVTFVGDDSTADGIDGRDLHRLVSADLTPGGGDDTVYLANLGLSNGFNNAIGGGGAAVLVDGGGLVISGSTLSSNNAVGTPAPGGALYTFATNVVIDGSVFQGNDDATSGGAAYFKNSLVAITETTFTNNEARTGAAFAAYGGTLTASTISVSDNDSTYLGGAVTFQNSSVASVANSFIGRNDSTASALYTAGIIVSQSDLELAFTTVYDNAPSASGTDVSLLYGDLTVIGSVVGSSTDDTPSLGVMGSVNIVDAYSVSTGPGPGFTGSGSRNVAGGTLGLGSGALTGSGPGRPGLSPASTSVLVTGAPTSSLTTGLNVDQLGNPRPGPGTTWTIGSRQVPFTPTPPGPSPVYPPSAPREVTAVPGDGSAVVSWREPASSGSFPITDYRVTAGPGGASCLVKAPATSCEITGLTNGRPYTFAVEALNGAGWGSKSEPSEPVTPERGCSRVTIKLDQGTRVAAGRHDRIRTGGSTTCIPEGTLLTPHIRYAGQSEFSNGKATITVTSDGSFEWTRLIRKDRRLTAYVSYLDTQSNKVVWAKVLQL